MAVTAPVYDFQAVATLLDLTYTEAELLSFGTPPPAAPGFVTFFDPGWSIIRVKNATKDGGCLNPLVEKQGPVWHWDGDGRFARHAFLKEEDLPRYRQLRMEPVPRTFDRVFFEQRGYLPRGETVPTARVIFLGMVIHFLLTGERLLELHAMNSASRNSVDHYIVHVGPFEDQGIMMMDFGTGSSHAFLGLGSCRV